MHKTAMKRDIPDQQLVLVPNWLREGITFWSILMGNQRVSKFQGLRGKPMFKGPPAIQRIYFLRDGAFRDYFPHKLPESQQRG